MLDKFDMSNSKVVSTPLENHFKLSFDQYPKKDAEAEYMSKVPYASVFGCLMYVMVYSRPKFSQVLCQVCTFMYKLGKGHMKDIKCIFRYWKGTMSYGIMFSNEHGYPSVVRYIDSDCVSYMGDRRCTTKYVFTLSREPISLKSLVQSIVDMSINGVEYMAAG